MPSDTRNVKLGVCTVTYDGVDLGYTKGGVEVEVKSETKKVMVDQFGNTPINEYILGRTCTVKAPLAETTLEVLARLMPGATLSSVGGVKASGTVTFATGAPSNNDVVTINGVSFTFKTIATLSTDISLTGITTFGQAATALAAAVNASIDPLVSQITATVAAGVVTLTADDAGVEGNLVTLAKTGTNITVSGATLASGADPTKKKVSVTNGVGSSLLTAARKLVLHPIANLPSDRSEDFTIPLAGTAGDMQFAFKLDDERIYNCTFEAYPNATTKVMFIIGDETAP